MLVDRSAVQMAAAIDMTPYEEDSAHLSVRGYRVGTVGKACVFSLHTLIGSHGFPDESAW